MIINGRYSPHPSPRVQRSFALILLMLASTLVLSGCSGSSLAIPTSISPPTNTAQVVPTSTSRPSAVPQLLPTRASTSGNPERLILQVLSVMPHDTSSYTEGLLWDNGFLYESSGLYGKSNIRKVDPKTGQVLQRQDDPTQVFGEGLALDGNQLVQLTWQEHTAYIYDRDRFTQTGSFSYQGEGWGLCYDGEHFYMSNGSATISARDGKTFAVINQVQVVWSGKPVTMVNELECVEDSLYANVWRTNNILRIDKASGQVTAVIDASGLMTEQEYAEAGDDGVLNGIAYDPQSGTFFITGKQWPKLFQVKFVPK